MSFVYITGLSGAGKSSVLEELRNRGFEAHGVDEDGYADWVDRETGVIRQMPYPPGLDFDIHDWFARHEWVLNPERVRKLKQEADKKHKTIFLCGAASGEDSAWDSFDTVCALIIGADTVERRIRDRQNNDFGKTPEELEKILHWHSTSEDRYRQFGATLIDAEQPLEKVVDEILDTIRPK